MSLHIEIGEFQKISEDTVRCPMNTNLKEALSFFDIPVSFACSGEGRCGKCRITVTDGSVPVSEFDKEHLTEEETASGIRLACGVTVTGPMTIEFNPENSIYIPSTYETGPVIHEYPNPINYSFAVDIGTTTIAVAAVASDTGAVFDEYTCLNHQRTYGADVLSRILASNCGSGRKLRDIVINDINTAIGTIMKRNGLMVERLDKIAVAGNTAMQHIFAGYSTEGLGMAPFAPVTTQLTQTDSGILLPGISAFVGADFVAGMYETGAFSSEAISMFIDLGTNGEMALGNRDRILVTSTAAGPAFEGASLSCGTGSVPGAISDVTLSDEDDEDPITLTLIDGADKPVGICGSGIISLVSELLKNGLISAEGKLDERLNGRLKLTADGSVTVTQKDIRELQLAKAAIRAGIETLMFSYGINADEISKVYLAGGFGKGIDIAKAAAIGLLPAELTELTEAVGNTALKGTTKFLTTEQAEEDLKRLINASQEILLADNEYFTGRFIEAMNFPS